MDGNEVTAPEHTINEKTAIPLPWAATITVTLVMWAISLTGVYFKLEAQITAVRTEMSVSAENKHHDQDQKIEALESDQKTIKQATCALARRSSLLVAGCE